ncbi:unnamed protein product [Paramecium pentaurelia]|uniref:Uncharacterized protein n=1 Tax=Paramecium pentaurelia TaxID=43138 RepID=A0A8S1XHB8_9CILI|nr:unnamed protein product [Paramecium pentaurelia]
MDFKSRFKGKMTIMNKEGVIGMVNKPSIPIAKNNSYLSQKNELSPTIQNLGHNTEGIRETKSHIFTNIQTSPNKRNLTNYGQKFSNAGQQIIKQNHVKTEHHYYLDDPKKQLNQLQFKMHQDFNQLNMDEYEIVAIPKTMLGQLRQQLSVDKYGLNKSFGTDKKIPVELSQLSPQITTKCTSYNQTPLLKKQNTFDQMLRPPFNKQRSEKMEKKNQIIQQAGIGTLRYNSYSKR